MQTPPPGVKPRTLLSWGSHANLPLFLMEKKHKTWFFNFISLMLSLSLTLYILSVCLIQTQRESYRQKIAEKKQAVEWILTHGALIWLMIWRRAASIPQASWRHAWKCSYQTNRWQKLPTRSSEMRRTFHHFQAKMRETSSSFSQVPLCLIAFHSSERCE